MRIETTLAALLVLCAGAAQSQQNMVPSCYAANQIETPPPAPQRSVFLLIDETTVFGDKLKAAAWDLITPAVEPGTQLTVFRFSAFAQQRFTTLAFSGYLEPNLSSAARNATSVKKLKSFDECRAGQQGFVLRKLQGVMSDAFSSASSDLQRSDVLGALQSTSTAIRNAPGSNKWVLVLSDMLENSSITSFYSSKGPRRIDPATELDKVTKADMLADFGGAHVWVFGAGLVAADAASKQGIYRDPLTMKALQTFWSQYIQRSKGSLVEFGDPELKQALH